MKKVFQNFKTPWLAALLLALFGLSALQAQTVPSPQQTDQIITDPNGNSKADPGDKIRYKVTIQNTGGGTATGTTLNAVPDAKTTFSAGSFRSSPLAFDDGPYTCIGNVGITVPDGASDLLANDFDDAPAGLSATVVTNAATTQGGSITIAANGSFSYNPPRGYEGTDTYTYTLNDGNAVAGVTATNTGIVTFTVSGMIWFTNNNAGACAASCDGRMSNPFTSLAAFNTANALAGGLNPDDNDNIFVYESPTAYTSGIVLRNGQKLFGQDATVTLLAATGLSQPTFGNALPATNSGNGTIVNITNAAGDGITLPSGSNTVRGLTVGNSSDFAIESSNTGTLTISETNINTTGSGFRNVAGGVLAVALGSLTSTGGLHAVNLTGTSGTFDVSGTTTASGHSNDAISLNSTSTTVTFGVTTVTASGSNQAILIQNNTGPVSFAAGSSATGSSNEEILLSGGTGNVTYNGSVTNTSGGAISVSSRTGGTAAFTGNISHTASSTGIFANANTGGTINFSGASKSINSSTSTGVNLASNTGATINFTGGGLVISTTSGSGFTATGGGTVTVQGTGNTITSTTGTALNVASTTIGASGLTFQSISANGGANGIVLNTTGSGGLNVTGTGTTDGTGGTIQNTTGRGADFISASNITLKNMNFTNAGTSDLDADNSGLSTGDNLATNASIHLQTVTTATLDNLNISGGAEQGINGNTVSNFTLSNSSIVDAGNGPDEDGIHFYNMSGTSAITNTTINCTVATPNTTGGDDHLNLQMQSGTLNLTISGGSATNANKGSGYLFGIRGTANATITFSSASSTDNFSGGIVADAFDSAIMDLTVSNSTSSGNNDQLSVSAGDNSDVELTATGNTLSSPNTGDFVVVSLLGSAFDTGYDFDASFSSNTITVGNGRTADGFTIFNAGGGAMDIAITNNTINYAGTQRTILVQAGQDGNGSTNVTITGNNIDIELDGTGNGSGILAQSAITGPGNTSSVCADIGGAGALKNTFTHSLGGTIAAGDIRVRQRNDGTVRLPGYAGAATDAAAVIAYLGGRNTIVSASTATFDSSGFAGGGACVQPSH